MQPEVPAAGIIYFFEVPVFLPTSEFSAAGSGFLCN
jgi:hypothetical protein